MILMPINLTPKLLDAKTMLMNLGRPMSEFFSPELSLIQPSEECGVGPS